MSMRLYLAQIIDDTVDPHRSLLAIFLGGSWSIIHQHFALFPSSNPVFAVTFFWSTSWIVGTYTAIRKREWSATRSRNSIGRWLLWMIALAAAWIIREAVMAGGTIADIIVAAVMLTEAGILLKVLAEASDHVVAKRVLGFFASALEGRVEQLEHRMVAGEEHSATNAAGIAANAAHIHTIEEESKP